MVSFATVVQVACEPVHSNSIWKTRFLITSEGDVARGKSVIEPSSDKFRRSPRPTFPSTYLGVSRDGGRHTWPPRT